MLISLAALIILGFVSNSLFAQGTSIVIPDGLISSAAFNTIFMAKAALFIACLLGGVVIIGMVLNRVLKFPTIAGHIIGGIILGPSLLNIASYSLFNAPLTLMSSSDVAYTIGSSDLILFFISMVSSLVTVSSLLWMAGHETDLVQLKKVGVIAVFAGILGALVPIATSMLLLLPMGTSVAQMMAMGLIFSATSVSIPVAMLIGYKKMQTRFARATLGAAVVDDIIAVTLLSFFFILFPAAGAMHHAYCISSALGWMAFGSLLIVGLGWYVLPSIIKWSERNDDSLLATVAYGIMMIYFALSELVAGLAGITGAYFAGLFYRKSDSQHRAYAIMAPFVQSILLPLFLGSIGLTLNVGLLGAKQWLLVVILFIGAVLSKLVACCITTLVSNQFMNKNEQWSLQESYLFGSSMVARGEVGLVVATLVASAGFICPEWYSIAVVVIVLTTIATPLLLAFGFSREKRKTQYEYVLALGGTLAQDDIEHIVSHLGKSGLKAQLMEIGGKQSIILVDREIAIELDGVNAHIIGESESVNGILPLLDKTIQERANQGKVSGSCPLQ